jgi:hypothetical protein
MRDVEKPLWIIAREKDYVPSIHKYNYPMNPEED